MVLGSSVAPKRSRKPFTPGSVSFNVSDIDLPDLKVASIVVPETALSGAAATITYTVRNDGLSTANGPWQDYFYVSTTPDGANISKIGQHFHTASLNVGQSYERSQELTLPSYAAARLPAPRS